MVDEMARELSDTVCWIWTKIYGVNSKLSVISLAGYISGLTFLKVSSGRVDIVVGGARVGSCLSEFHHRQITSDVQPLKGSWPSYEHTQHRASWLVME